MLRFAKKDVRSIYTVEDDGGRTIDPLRSSGSWASATTAVDGVAIEMSGSSRERVEVRRDGQPLASATCPDGRTAEFAIEHDGPTLTLTRAKGKRYDASIDGVPVGGLALVGFAGRRAEVDLPESLPIEVRLLASFVALRTWNRQAST